MQNLQHLLAYVKQMALLARTFQKSAAAITVLLLTVCNGFLACTAALATMRLAVLFAFCRT